MSDRFAVRACTWSWRAPSTAAAAGTPARTTWPNSRRVTTIAAACLAAAERVANELHAVLHFLDRRRLAHVLVLDDRVARVRLFLQQPQHVGHRRLGLPPRLVRTVVASPVLQMQV